MVNNKVNIKVRDVIIRLNIRLILDFYSNHYLKKNHRINKLMCNVFDSISYNMSIIVATMPLNLLWLKSMNAYLKNYFSDKFCPN